MTSTGAYSEGIGILVRVLLLLAVAGGAMIGNGGSDRLDSVSTWGAGGHGSDDSDVRGGLVVGRKDEAVDAARTWASYPMRPSRVETVAVAGGRRLALVQRQPELAVGVARAIICADPWTCFRQGYRDFNGRPEWLDHFIDNVILNCENKTYGWVWYPEASSFITVAQFHPDTWARASTATGLDDPYNLYHVGAAVAYWSSSIEHPGTSGGWAECWKQEVVPNG